jgi:hypothetical protein
LTFFSKFSNVFAIFCIFKLSKAVGFAGAVIGNVGDFTRGLFGAPETVPTSGCALGIGVSAATGDTASGNPAAGSCGVWACCG